MRRPQVTIRVKRALLAACVLGAVTSLPSAPAWAYPRHHRPPPTFVTTTTTTPLPSGTGLPQPVPPTPAAVDNCGHGSWPGDVQGAPASYQTSTDGAYLWYDPDGGWALRVTHPGARGRVIFSGTITTASGTFTDVHSSGGEGSDIVFVAPGKHSVLFRFVNFGQVGGLDFATHCTSAFRVNIHVSGQLAPVSNIFLGGQGTNPATNPFRVARVRGAGSAGVTPTGRGRSSTGTTLAATTKRTLAATTKRTAPSTPAKTTIG